MIKKRMIFLLAAAVALTALGGCRQGAGSLEGTGTREEIQGGSLEDGAGQASGESGGTGSSGSGENGGGQEASGGGSEETNGEVPILKDEVMKTMGCRVGCAATASELEDEKVWEIITTHFNALTIGNELKPDAMVGYSVSKCPGTEEAELNGETIVVPKLDYSRAEKMLDKIYDWNQENPENAIKVRGHVLVWHSQTPEWFFHVDYDKKKDYVDKDTMNKRLEWYIRTMLTHFTGEDSKYKDLFYGWDVVNEAISDGTGTYRTDSENANESLSEDRHGSNSSWWHVYQSNEFIINAFIYANKYAPADLELYYNDYNECTFAKMQGIAALLTELKEKEGEPGVGTRITGMGMQGHYDMSSPAMDKVELAVKTYGAIVGNVQITEFDLKASDGYDGSEEAKAEEYEKQATRYRVLYWVLKTQNAKEDINVTGITFWGTVDHYSWLQSRSNVGGGNTGSLLQCPLLFDENYEPKPAFYSFVEKE
ncbi:MAG: endo-1,4-beta-xylanase [Roseburia sp.]|nr:endo-1,4-beta-xylanase [Roseburia sp.]MCM1097093.1 endo-1,4-beta-xylanase [Ruminococcus flavefaciens]